MTGNNGQRQTEANRLTPGAVVCWQRIGGEWATGTVIGPAPCDDGCGGAMVEVQASNGRVYVAVGVLV